MTTTEYTTSCTLLSFEYDYWRITALVETGSKRVRKLYIGIAYPDDPKVRMPTPIDYASILKEIENEIKTELR